MANYNYKDKDITNAFAENLEPRHSGEELLDLSAIGYHANKQDAELQSPANGNGIARQKAIPCFQKAENGNSAPIYGVEKGTFPVVCSDNTDGSRIKLKGSTITKAIEYIANNTIFTITKDKNTKQVTIGGTNFGTADDDIKYISLVLVGGGGSGGGSAEADTDGCNKDGCGDSRNKLFPGAGGGGGGIFIAVLDVEHYEYTIKLGKGGAGVNNATYTTHTQHGSNGINGEDSAIFLGDSCDWEKVIAVVHGGSGGKGGNYDDSNNSTLLSAAGGAGGEITIYDSSHLIKTAYICGGTGSDASYNEGDTNINISQQTTIRPLFCGKNDAVKINKQLNAIPADTTKLKDADGANFTFCVPGGNSFGNGGYAEISLDIVQAATNPLYGGGGGDFYSKNTTTVTSSQSGANGCAVFFY